MSRDSNYKAVSFRFNMDVEEDKKLYGQLSAMADGYTSLSACMKSIVAEYFSVIDTVKAQNDFYAFFLEKYKDLNQELINNMREEFQLQSAKILGALVSGMSINSSNLNIAKVEESSFSKEKQLPDISETVPDALEDFLNKF